MRVAFGLKARTGRAALVAVAGDVHEPQLVERSQIQLLPDGAFAPYHAAEGLAPEDARESVRQSIAAAHRLATSGIRGPPWGKDQKVAAAAALVALKRAKRGSLR